jgi:nucleotide-binding universal stress UspA family protein
LCELAEAVDAGRTGDRVKELEKVLRIFRQEWGKGDSDFLALYDFIERTNIDLIVVGSRGLRAFKKMLIGIVSAAVVNHAHCSVLVVR